MHNEFTAIIERDGDWFIGYCPEIPGANGQGRTKDECIDSLKAAVSLILMDRREDGFRDLPDDALREVITIEWTRSPSGMPKVATDLKQKAGRE